MSSFEHLANELLLHLISYLPLKSLIAFRGIDRRSEQLVAAAEIQPAPREFLNLYLTIVYSPYFLQSRPWVLANLRPFDREAYVDALLTQYPRLPEDFRVWISEWPARAVVGAAWPGLPLEHRYLLSGDDVERFDGVNWLATIPPVVSALTWSVPGPTDSFDFVPGLLIRVDNHRIWLIIDDDDDGEEKDTLQLRDKVFTLFFGDSHIEDQGVPRSGM